MEKRRTNDDTSNKICFISCDGGTKDGERESQGIIVLLFSTMERRNTKKVAER